MTDPFAADPDPAAASSHIAGTPVTWSGKHLRQRCAWCGTLIIDQDLTAIAWPDSIPPDDRTVGTWPELHLIRIDNGLAYDLGPAADTSAPPDACVHP